MTTDQYPRIHVTTPAHGSEAHEALPAIQAWYPTWARIPAASLADSLGATVSEAEGEEDSPARAVFCFRDGSRVEAVGSGISHYCLIKVDDETSVAKFSLVINGEIIQHMHAVDAEEALFDIAWEQRLRDAEANNLDWQWEIRDASDAVVKSGHLEARPAMDLWATHRERTAQK